MLKRSNNSWISIETSAPQEAGGFVIKHYFGISNYCMQIKKFSYRLTSKQSMPNHVLLC